jgi:hypothetical protein
MVREIKEAVKQLRIDDEAKDLHYEAILDDLEQQVVQGKRTMEDLENPMANLKQIETKSGGIYRTNVRLAYHDLLLRGVSANIIGDVIRSVLELMTEGDTSNLSLPARSTAQSFVTEAGELARIRTAYELAKTQGNLGHHSDGTTKSPIHW